MDGLQLAPEAVCSTWCDWEDLPCMRVISLAGWVGFLRSQIWTPALVLRLTRMDSMEWMLWLVPIVLTPFILQPGRETPVKPIHFFNTVEN